jgi:hypothetical protein
MLQRDADNGVDVFANDTRLTADARPMAPVTLPPPDWYGEDRRAVETEPLPPPAASATPNLDRVRAELQAQQEGAAGQADLAPLYDAALPGDAPGAWVRQAIDELEVVEHDSHLLDAGDVEIRYEGDRDQELEL